MGSQQSKTASPELNEKLADRLRSLSLEGTTAGQPEMSSIETDYVKIVSEKSGIVKKMSSSKPTPQTVSISAAEQWSKAALADPKNQLALSALSANSPNDVLTQRAAKMLDTQTFNVKIPLEGSPITNQRASGRCWLFASTNVFRVALMKRHNLADFQLSQAYLFFWDKLEKANWFMEQILDTADEEVTSRTVQTLLSSPVGDGGQWDMAVNLVHKYGLVPQVLYPDSWNAMNSSTVDSILTMKLRENALKLRALKADTRKNRTSTLTSMKETMMKEIHLILTLCFGPPPAPDKEFTWQYYTADGTYKSLVATPLSFASELSAPLSIRANANSDPNRMFSLVNDPRNPLNSHLTVNRLGNVVGGKPIRYANVDLATMKRACVAMLKKGLPIFFGCDVGKFLDRVDGIMDTALIDYELGFNIRLGMTKADRLVTGASQMTHAMVLTGVHLDEGSGLPVRWRIQNSWGEGAGSGGYYVMTDRWWDQFVYQAVVDPAFVDKETRDIMKKEPVVLDLWDPMGALA